MQEPLVIPRVLIERFLQKLIPRAAEMLSWMRIEDTGDGLSPELRQRLSNLKVSGWLGKSLSGPAERAEVQVSDGDAA